MAILLYTFQSRHRPPRTPRLGAHGEKGSYRGVRGPWKGLIGSERPYKGHHAD